VCEAPVTNLSATSLTLRPVISSITERAYPIRRAGKLAFMTGRPAGVRYPHATTEAREADHRFCAVLEAVRQAVASGRDQWGTRYPMPDRLTAAEAKEAVKGLYRARNHTSLKRGACGTEPLSVQAGHEANGDGTYSVWLRVWSRALARAEIVRRVQAGEQLPYNPMRKRVDLDVLFQLWYAGRRRRRRRGRGRNDRRHGASRNHSHQPGRRCEDRP